MDIAKKLSGRTAMITGAGRGIGKATALLFADNGADLVLVSRGANELAQTAEACAKLGAKVHAEPLDISDFRRIHKLFDVLGSRNLSVDILVNNAAILPKSLMNQVTTDEFKKVLDTNLVAPMYLCQKVIPTMTKRGGGTIVNVSSLSGCFGVPKFPGFGAYNISKYGLWGLTEILAIENHSVGIRVNQISLAAVDTKMYRENAPPELKANMTADDVARHILFLASDDSAPLTGNNTILTGIPVKR